MTSTPLLVECRCPACALLVWRLPLAEWTCECGVQLKAALARGRAGGMDVCRMTVGELRELLAEFEPGLEVALEHSYRDEIDASALIDADVQLVRRDLGFPDSPHLLEIDSGNCSEQPGNPWRAVLVLS